MTNKTAETKSLFFNSRFYSLIDLNSTEAVRLALDLFENSNLDSLRKFSDHFAIRIPKGQSASKEFSSRERDWITHSCAQLKKVAVNNTIPTSFLSICLEGKTGLDVKQYMLSQNLIAKRNGGGKFKNEEYRAVRSTMIEILRKYLDSRKPTQPAVLVPSQNTKHHLTNNKSHTTANTTFHTPSRVIVFNRLNNQRPIPPPTSRSSFSMVSDEGHTKKRSRETDRFYDDTDDERYAKKQKTTQQSDILSSLKIPKFSSSPPRQSTTSSHSLGDHKNRESKGCEKNKGKNAISQSHFTERNHPHHQSDFMFFAEPKEVATSFDSQEDVYITLEELERDINIPTAPCVEVIDLEDDDFNYSSSNSAITC